MYPFFTLSMEEVWLLQRLKSAYTMHEYKTFLDDNFIKITTLFREWTLTVGLWVMDFVKCH